MDMAPNIVQNVIDFIADKCYAMKYVYKLVSDTAQLIVD